MTRTPRMLVLPAILTVTTFVALPACETDPGDEEGGVTTNASGGTDEGGCFDLSDMAACDADAMCEWYPDLTSCLPDCPTYETQDACMDTEVCAWDSNEGCLGPFT